MNQDNSINQDIDFIGTVPQLHRSMNQQKRYKVRVQIPYNTQKENIIKTIEIYQQTICRNILYCILCLTTGGLFYLLSRWYVKLQIEVRFKRSNVENADYFLIHGIDKTITLLVASKQIISIQNNRKMYKIFEYRFLKYYFDDNQDEFIPIELNLSIQQNSQILREYHRGIVDQNQLDELRCKFGLNSTTIPDKSILTALIEESLNPFYIFSVFSLCIWYIQNYIIFATFILIFSLTSIGGTLHQFFVNFHQLQAIAQSESIVKVYRFCVGLTKIQNGKVIINEQVLQSCCIIQISSKFLVPGDMIQIEDNQLMPCDLILLTGQCLMNEAMLTGESIPILKNVLPYNQFAYNFAEEGRLSTLLSGTICVETKIAHKGNQPVLALVTQTGFKTLKGQLILSILFKSPSTFKFYQDAMKYIAVLAVLAVIGCLITIKSKLDSMQELGIDKSQILISLLALVTTTIPPAMPIFLQIGISIGLYRLKKQGIFCISPTKITTAGNITVMCFDKTGTLTEDSMDMYSVMTVGINPTNQELGFSTFKDQTPQNVELITTNQLVDDINLNNFKDGQNNDYIQSARLLIKYTMASCHGLTLLQGKLIGDPLDIKVFEATFSKILDGNDTGYQQIVQIPNFTDLGLEVSLSGNITRLEIIRKFEFQSKLQRMTVIVRTPDGVRLFCKGSPEIIRQLCTPQSIPQTFHEVLDNHTKKGFRVIACAARTVTFNNSIINSDRKKFECNLTLIGFIILRNKLKRITSKVIQDLQKANIQTIMVTGDNIFTAISVARSCSIIQINQDIYYGELDQVKRYQKPKIVWKNFDKSDTKLTEIQVIPDPQVEGINQLIKLEILGSNRATKNHSFRLNSKEQKSMMKKLKQQKETQPLTKSSKIVNEELEPWMDSSNDYVLALSGAVLNFLIEKDEFNPDVKYQNILERAKVYARVSPEDKGVLIKQLKTRLLSKPLVGFCGDGANDCVALNTADVGISINQAEASISAPFTSQVGDISCVPILLCEGRAALTTSFICFKYMVMYSTIEFMTSCLLYLSYTDMPNNQYLFIDLLTVLPISMTMGLTQARTTLTKQIPRSSLLSFGVICSVVGQGIIQVLFQIIIYVKLLQQDWFIPAQNLYPPDQDELDEAIHISYESTNMFLFSNLQYVFTIIAFSSGTPFRKPFYTNIYFTLCCIFKLALDYSLIIFYKSDELPIYQYLGLRFSSGATSIPKQWMIFLGMITLVNGFVSLIYERLIVTLLQKIFSKKKSLC